MYLRGSRGYEVQQSRMRPPFLTARPSSIMAAPASTTAFGNWPPWTLPASPTPTVTSGQLHAHVEGHLPPEVRDHAISANAAAKRPRLEPDTRKKALQFLVDLAVEFCTDAPMVETAQAEEGEVTVDSPSFTAALSVKSTGTLMKRASSLMIYKTWFLGSGLRVQDFCAEHAIFRYVYMLYTDKAPATRASALREAMNFLAGLTGADVSNMRASARISGMCSTLLRSKGEVRQRRPLTVKQVATLERVLADDGGRGSADAIIAGTALFAVFSRSRVGDLRRCATEPELDMHGGSGYVEARFLDYKTAKPGTRRALPVIATVHGVTATTWAVSWRTARQAAGLNADEQKTLLPAMSANGGWLAAPWTTVEFAAAFRGVLLRAGHDATELENVGARSLKTTCLTWASKHGVPKDIRCTLGYHVASDDHTVETYSRDGMSHPLRCLDKVIADIRIGHFLPDTTRSGVFPRG